MLSFSARANENRSPNVPDDESTAQQIRIAHNQQRYGISSAGAAASSSSLGPNGLRSYFSRRKGKGPNGALPEGEMSQLVREAIVKSEFIRDVALRKKDRMQVADELCRLLHAIEASGSSGKAIGGDWMKRYFDLEKQMKSENDVLADARKQLHVMQTQLAVVTAQKDDASERLGKLDGENTQCLNSVFQAKDAVEARLLASLSAQDALQRKLLKSSQEMDALVAENQQLIAEKASLEDENIRLHRREMDADSTRKEAIGLAAELNALKKLGAPDRANSAATNQAASDPKLVEQLAKLERERDELKYVAGNSESIIAQKDAEIAKLRKELDGHNHKFETMRRKLHNQLQEAKGNVRVMCRVRPLLPKEQNDGLANIQAHSLNPEITLFSDTKRNGEATKNAFTFDGVFDSASTQTQVFDEVELFVQSALDGFHVCLLAYGQTGSGKTHTMLGSDAALGGGERGVIPRSVEKIFAHVSELRKVGWTYTTSVSCLEIYKESIRDLLGKGTLDDANRHQIHRDADGQTIVDHLQEEACSSDQEALAFIERAMKVRATAATSMNIESSRSHFVFWMRIHATQQGSGQRLVGSLFLVDLAGSERLNRSNATGNRRDEAISINKSLSALGNVMQAISKKERHVPYRESKLTWLLQPCLAGSGKALMLVNMSPSAANTQESLCTLRFGAIASSCELGKAKRNVTVDMSRQASRLGGLSDVEHLRPSAGSNHSESNRSSESSRHNQLRPGAVSAQRSWAQLPRSR